MMKNGHKIWKPAPGRGLARSLMILGLPSWAGHARSTNHISAVLSIGPGLEARHVGAGGGAAAGSCWDDNRLRAEMMKENNGSARKKVKPRSEAFLVSPEETKSVSSLARNRSRVRRVVYIDKPVSWSGGAFWSLLIVLLHYMIFAFLFLTGLYHNYSEPPVQLALIPSFTAGCVSVFGILCIPLQANKYIRFLLRPSSGMLLSVAAMIGAGVWSAMLYGPLQKNFSQAFQYLESSGAGVIYLLLVYRRLKFADSAFSAGAESLLRVRSIFVRACVHALLHILYIVLWSFCYINLIEVKDVSSTSNATKTANPFPQWSTGGGTYVTFGSPSLWVAKTFLLYNLYSVTMMVKTLKCMSASLIHTQIKSSLWISIWSISSKLSEAARNQSEVVLLSDYQEKLYFRKKLPTILMASQFLIISQILNSFTEAFRRSSRVRSGGASLKLRLRLSHSLSIAQARCTILEHLPPSSPTGYPSATISLGCPSTRRTGSTLFASRKRCGS
eukprot:756670-Hanusia_phi.AAC.13